MIENAPAKVLLEGRGAIAICLDCEWSSPETRNEEAAKARAEIHNRMKHGKAQGRD